MEGHSLIWKSGKYGHFCLSQGAFLFRLNLLPFFKIVIGQLVPVCFCRESQITPGKAEWSKNVQRFEAFEIAYLKIWSTTHFAFGLNDWVLEHLLYISQVEFADFCRHNKSSPITQLLKLSFTATFSPPFSELPLAVTFYWGKLAENSQEFGQT